MMAAENTVLSLYGFTVSFISDCFFSMGLQFQSDKCKVFFDSTTSESHGFLFVIALLEFDSRFWYYNSS